MEQFRLEIAHEISRDMAMLGISSLAEMKRELQVPIRGPIGLPPSSGHLFVNRLD